MIIDFHTHTFPDKIAGKVIESLASKANLTPTSDGTNLGLIKSMEKANIDLSIILPVITSVKQTKTVNDCAILTNKTYSNLISFGGISPDDENFKIELDRLKNSNIKGIKLHPDYQNTFFDDIKYINIINYAFKLGLIVVVHAGLDIGYPDVVHASIDRIIKVINSLEYKGALVLAHMGGWNNYEEVYNRLAGLDIYLDTSFAIGKIKNRNDIKTIDNELFNKFVKKHGANKILFATDCPWGDQDEMVKALNGFSLTKEEKKLIFYKNSAKLLNI